MITLKRSYSIYLCNVLAQIAILTWLGHTAVGDIAWLATFMILAEASFRFVERPLRAKLARKSVAKSEVRDPLVAVRRQAEG